MKTIGIIATSLLVIMAGFASNSVHADLNALIAMQDTKAPVGKKSLPNHPRACQVGEKLCFHNLQKGATFADKAKSLAKANQGVATAEEIIRYSGWEDYRNEQVLMMDEYYYSYAVSPPTVTVTVAGL